MSHLENVYKLACELRIEIALALRDGHRYYRYGATDRELGRLIDWTLVNLPIKEMTKTNENADNK